jgi:hypothetical protein
MNAALQDHVSHYCSVVYGEGMKAEVDKVVKDLIGLIPGTSGFEIAHAVRIYNSRTVLNHVNNLDCPKRCGEWSYLKNRILSETIRADGELITIRDRNTALQLQAECSSNHVYCERSLEVEKRLKAYQAACPNYDLNLRDNRDR